MSKDTRKVDSFKIFCRFANDSWVVKLNNLKKKPTKMENIILFDDLELRQQLKPFSYTRPIGEFRVGILTIREKWEIDLGLETSYQTVFHLADKFPCKFGSVNILINSAVFPTPALCARIRRLPVHHTLIYEDSVIAMKLDGLSTRQHFSGVKLEHLAEIELDIPLIQLNHIWDIFAMNEQELALDFKRLTTGRSSEPLSNTNKLLGPSDQLFIEEGAAIECSILNTLTGPIYIGKDAQILEGSMVRGPFAMNEHAALKMGSKIYGATTLGPHCKVGGELNNVVFFGYSNKGHDGFLGNSVIGEWCNLGADTNNSNLKNNYSEVKVWNYASDTFENTGLQFCGLFMGDHSKCGINTMFNTGTVVGVSANIFGAGFPAKFIPSFTWGGVEKSVTYRLEDAMDTAERVMKRRAIDYTDVEEQIMGAVFNEDHEYRVWDHKDQEDDIEDSSFELI